MLNNKNSIKTIKYNLYSIFFFLLLKKKTCLRSPYINFFLFTFFNKIYLSFFFNVLLPFLLNNKSLDGYLNSSLLNKLGSFNNLPFFSKIYVFKKSLFKNWISKLALNNFNGNIHFEKIYLSNLFEFQNIKNMVHIKNIKNKLIYFFCNVLIRIFKLLYSNLITNPNIFQKIKNLIFYFKYLDNITKYFYKKNYYQDIYILPYKNIKNKKVIDLHLLNSINFGFFVRRFRTIFYLFIFYLYLFWFNKLILKINYKNIYIFKIIKNINIFNYFKIKISLSLKPIWLNYKILIPNFNLNYLLYNNIIKKQW